MADVGATPSFAEASDGMREPPVLIYINFMGGEEETERRPFGLPESRSFGKRIPNGR